jgi:hypothetical protein
MRQLVEFLQTFVECLGHGVHHARAVDTHGQLAGLGEVAKQINRRKLRPPLGDARDASLVVERMKPLHCCAFLGGRGFASGSNDFEQVRGVTQQAGGFAGLRVPDDFARQRVGRVACDAGDFERLGVGQRHRAAVPIDRVVRRGCVLFLLRWQPAFLHARRINAFQNNPTAGRQFPRLVVNILERVGE